MEMVHSDYFGITVSLVLLASTLGQFIYASFFSDQFWGIFLYSSQSFKNFPPDSNSVDKRFAVYSFHGPSIGFDAGASYGVVCAA
jgi:hypothetical protein